MTEERTFPTTTTGPDPAREVLPVRPSISWGGIFAGAFVALLVYLALSALGMALGAAGLESVISEGGVEGLTIGAVIWLVITALISLFVGGYVAARAAGVMPTRSGGVQGLVVSALFFMVLFTGIGAGIGMLSGAAGSLVSTVASGAGSIVQDPRVQSVIGESMAGLNVPNPQVVARNVATRLLRGDDDGAKAYLARVAGISPAEADRRIGQAKAQVLGAAQTAAKAAAQAVQLAGWSLFVVTVLGSIVALFGGAFGARRNITYPLSERDRRAALDARADWLPARPQPVARP